MRFTFGTPRPLEPYMLNVEYHAYLLPPQVASKCCLSCSRTFLIARLAFCLRSLLPFS